MLAQAGGGYGWYTALIPATGVLVAFFAAWVATYPQRKDRRQQDKARQDRELRLDATADEVLGTPANLNTGHPAQPGIREQVKGQQTKLDELDRKIGVSKDGRPLAQILEDALSELRQVRIRQNDADDMIDEQRAGLRKTDEQVAGHERRLGRHDQEFTTIRQQLRMGPGPKETT